MANKVTDLTPKQQHFCRAVVSGCTMSDAYREAYNTANMKPATINREAHSLMADPKIATRVQQLNRDKDRALVSAAVSDRDRVLNKLRDMMDSAEAESVQLGAAVALGKTQALFTNVVEQKQVRTLDEVKAELERRLGELLEEPDLRLN